jgi:cysteine desulfurase
VKFIRKKVGVQKIAGFVFSMKKIYLDNSATTSMDDEVKNEMNKYYSDIYGNPGSFHNEGLISKNAVSDARERIAKIIGSKSSEVIFTAGGTESINLAIKGRAFAIQGKKKHIVTSTIEHPAVLETCRYLEKKGFEVSYVSPDKNGLIDVNKIDEAIRDDTFLVSVIYANNEIGVIQDIEKISEICKSKNVTFHTDACQAAGYLDIDVNNLSVDMMSLNGSKIYGPKGVGLLYVKTGILIEPLIHGGGQEMNKRAGTENVPGIRGFAKALEIVITNREKEVERLSSLRDKLIQGIFDSISKVKLNGHATKRLPNNVNISFLDVEGEAILLYLDSKGVYASSGSACTSSTLDPSHVIVAMGIPYEYAHGSIRFSLGKDTTTEEVDYVLEILPGIVENLRNISPFNVDEKKLEGKNE